MSLMIKTTELEKRSIGRISERVCSEIGWKRMKEAGHFISSLALWHRSNCRQRTSTRIGRHSRAHNLPPHKIRIEVKQLCTVVNLARPALRPTLSHSPALHRSRLKSGPFSGHTLCRFESSSTKWQLWTLLPTLCSTCKASRICVSGRAPAT